MPEKIMPQAEIARSETEDVTPEEIVSPVKISSTIDKTQLALLCSVDGSLSEIELPERAKKRKALDEISESVLGYRLSEQYFYPKEIEAEEKSDYHEIISFQIPTMTDFQVLRSGDIIFSTSRDIMRFNPRTSQSEHILKVRLEAGDKIESIQVASDEKIFIQTDQHNLLECTRNGEGDFVTEDIDNLITKFQLLPDGRIVIEWMGDILILEKNSQNGKWDEEEVGAFTGWNYCLQARSDGDIFVGGDSGLACFRKVNGEWKQKNIYNDEEYTVTSIDASSPNGVLWGDPMGNISWSSKVLDKWITIGYHSSASNITINDVQSLPGSKSVFSFVGGGVFVVDDTGIGTKATRIDNPTSSFADEKIQLMPDGKIVVGGKGIVIYDGTPVKEENA